MMPQISGIEVCREVRKSSNVPILMLTAKGKRSTASWAWSWARTIIS